jgi:3-hydroxyacyl-[acyl-carrier-protein] dehydratase
MVYYADEIKKIIPHRPPFLLVDEVWELEPGKRAVGIKNVSEDEFYFQGHFPSYPVMPGVLIVEALAQVGAVAILSQKEAQGKLVFFAGIDKFRFRKPVFPGSQLRLELEILRSRGDIGKGKGIAYVGDEVVAEGELTFVLAERPRSEK